MNETDRRKILSNLDELCKKINYDRLKLLCVVRGIITDIMIREIEVAVWNGTDDTLLSVDD